MSIRDEKLIEYRDLIAWGWHTGLLSRASAGRLERTAARQPAAAARVFARAIRLRESLYRITKQAMVDSPPRRQDIAVLNRELALARAAERLAWSGRAAVWRWSSDRPALNRIVYQVAQSAADLFAYGDLARLRLCGGDDCGWLFEDMSRNGRRRWCDMRDCGNVAKVRRFRARHRRARR